MITRCKEDFCGKDHKNRYEYILTDFYRNTYYVNNDIFRSDVGTFAPGKVQDEKSCKATSNDDSNEKCYAWE